MKHESIDDIILYVDESYAMSLRASLFASPGREKHTLLGECDAYKNCWDQLMKLKANMEKQNGNN